MGLFPLQLCGVREKKTHVWTSTRDILELGFQNYTCNWGTDIALLYDDSGDALQTMTNIFEAGLQSGNRQCCVLSPAMEATFKNFYQQKFPEEFPLLSKESRVKFISQERTAVLLDPTDPLILNDLMDSIYFDSQNDQETCIRGFLDIQQAIPFYPSPKQLEELIFKINYSVFNKNWLQVTLYDIRKLSSVHLMKILECHRLVIKGDQFIQNSLYKLKPKK